MFRCNLHPYLKWFGIVTVLSLSARLYVIYAVHSLPVEHGVHSSDVEASVVMAKIRNMEKTNVWSLLCTVAVTLSLLLFHGSVHTAAAHRLLIAAAPPIWNDHSKKKKKDVPLVGFMYLVFMRMPGESYCRRLRSSLLYLWDDFGMLINSLVCWLATLNVDEGFHCIVLYRRRCWIVLFCHNLCVIRVSLNRLTSCSMYVGTSPGLSL